MNTKPQDSRPDKGISGRVSGLLHRAMSAFFAPELDFRVKIFNVLAMAGFLISIAMAFFSYINGSGLINTVLNIATSALSAFLLFFSVRTGRYQLCYMVTISAIFLGFFPFIFFTGGGYHSGMPAFFIFAIVFTVYMLTGKKCSLWRFWKRRYTSQYVYAPTGIRSLCGRLKPRATCFSTL